MTTEVNDLKATADAHIRRDLEQGGKWLCQCNACREIRSLTGMDKMFQVWPLVREIQLIGERLAVLTEGTERTLLLERSLKLYDQLAEAMAK
jgi:hypothetical protein